MLSASRPLLALLLSALLTSCADGEATPPLTPTSPENTGGTADLAAGSGGSHPGDTAGAKNGGQGGASAGAPSAGAPSAGSSGKAAGSGGAAAGSGGAAAGSGGKAGKAGSGTAGSGASAGAGGSGQAGAGVSGNSGQNGGSSTGAGGLPSGGAGGQTGEGGESGGGEGGSGQGSNGQGAGGASGGAGGALAGAGGASGGAGGVSCEDCDGDGWTAAQGDCCDQPEQCPGVDPKMVNPGAFDAPGNGVDDDCDGTPVDSDDSQLSCDAGLLPGAGAAEMARALGICRTTAENAAGWGLIEAALLRADGSPLADKGAASVRGSFGSLVGKAPEGERLVVLSTGVAADGAQLDPGTNGGAPEGTNVSNTHAPTSQVLLDQPGSPRSVSDWFALGNPPIKPPQSLPLLPGCPGQSSTLASDSVMLALRLRAPLNARSFSFKTMFVSAEYPEFVCTSYSDQFVALIDGGADNPPDKNLLVYRDEQGTPWPASLNLALTPLFDHCDPAADKPSCSKAKIHPQACGAGAAALAGTGFEAPPGKPCSIGGASRWLRVSGNVQPGQVFELRVALWDVGDALYDSVALLDAFAWGTDPVSAGTTPAPLRSRGRLTEAPRARGAPAAAPARLPRTTTRGLESPR